MPGDPSTERELLRHLLATIAYRATRAIQNSPDGFGAFRIREGSRTPVEILAHMGDLFDWALSIARGKEQWHDAEPQSWDSERTRFYATVKALDDYCAGSSSISCPVQLLIQGPIADALTHAGQLAQLRRLSGNPMRGENFFKADIVPGQVGPNQPPPRKTFE